MQPHGVLPMRFFLVASFFSLSALLLGGCASLQPPAQSHGQPQPSARAAGINDAAAKIRSAFQRDLAMCGGIIKRIGTDRDFVDAFLSAGDREAKSLAGLIRKSPYAQTPEYVYLLSNPDTIDVGVSYHGHPWAVAWVENEAIYCAPTLERMQDIEALGESAEAWQVREFFLDKALQYSESSGGDTSDANKIKQGEFQTLVQQASQRYTGEQRPQFIAWTRKAIDIIERQRSEETVDAPAGSALAGIYERMKRNAPPDERVTFLRGFLQDKH